MFKCLVTCSTLYHAVLFRYVHCIMTGLVFLMVLLSRMFYTHTQSPWVARVGHSLWLHTHTCTRTPMHMHTRVHTCTHVHPCTCMHTYTRAHTCTHMYIPHTRMHSYACAHTCARTHKQPVSNRLRFAVLLKILHSRRGPRLLNILGVIARR